MNNIRRIHPFVFYPIFLIIGMFVSKIQNTISFPLLILASLLIYVAPFLILNILTKGRKVVGYEDEKCGYIAYVSVSYFGERVRWCGYFKNKHVSHFCAMYQAWFLDHFGGVSSSCGIHYYVKSVESSNNEI